jgi:hypothetical protein
MIVVLLIVIAGHDLIIRERVIGCGGSQRVHDLHGAHDGRRRGRTGEFEAFFGTDLTERVEGRLFKVGDRPFRFTLDEFETFFSARRFEIRSRCGQRFGDEHSLSHDGPGSRDRGLGHFDDDYGSVILIRLPIARDKGGRRNGTERDQERSEDQRIVNMLGLGWLFLGEGLVMGPPLEFSRRTRTAVVESNDME